MSGAAILTRFSGYAEFVNCDLSSGASGINLLSFASVGIGSKVKFINCKMPVNYGWYNAYTYDAAMDIELIGCDNYFNYAYHNRMCDVEMNTMVFLNYSYDDIARASMKIETQSVVKGG